MVLIMMGLTVGIAGGVVYGLLKLTCPNYGLANKVRAKIKQDLLWTYFLRLFIESYLDLSISNGLRVMDLVFVNWFEIMTSVISIILEVSIIAFPIIITIVLYRKYKKVSDDKFQ